MLRFIEDRIALLEPEFAYEELEVLGDHSRMLHLSPFLFSKTCIPSVNVPVEKIAGVIGDEYAGKTWKQMLRFGREVEQRLKEAGANRSAVYSNERKTGLELFKLNGKYYVSSGVDKVVASRFVFWADGKADQPIRSVPVVEFDIDTEAEALVEDVADCVGGEDVRISKGFFNGDGPYKHLEFRVSRMDGRHGINIHGGEAKFYNTHLIARNTRTGKSFMTESLQTSRGKRDAYLLIEALRNRGFFSACFSKNPFARDVW